MMKCSDPNLQLGPMKDRKDYHATTKLLMKLREEQDRRTLWTAMLQDGWNGSAVIGKSTSHNRPHLHLFVEDTKLVAMVSVI